MENLNRPKPRPRNRNYNRNRNRRNRDQDHDHEEQEHTQTQAFSSGGRADESAEGTEPSLPASPEPPPGRTAESPRPSTSLSTTRPRSQAQSEAPSRTSRRRGAGTAHFSVEDDKDLDTSDFRRQIDRLERDLERRDRELEEERTENERALDTIKRLERDKVELKRELEGARDEAEDYRRALDDARSMSSRPRSKVRDSGSEVRRKESSGDESSGEEIKSHELRVQEKNREIEGLIEDNERLQEENHALEEKLAQLKDSLAEATKQIENMTNDHFNLKQRLQKADDRIRDLDEEKLVLTLKQKELQGYKERHDQYLENLCNAVDIRVDVWKKIMISKDEEIERLRNKVASLMNQIPNTQLDSDKTTIHLLNKKLSERENQILILNSRLSEATEEIEANSRLIESLQSNLSSHVSEPDRNLVQRMDHQIKRLEEKLGRRSRQIASLEAEAEEKSQTLTSLLARMSRYESGVYGLPEAVSEIKDLKTQIRVRDKQISGLTQELNLLQMQVSDSQEENEMLREKLGLEPDTDLTKESRRYTKSRKNEVLALRSKVTQLEEEVVTLKTRNYSLKKQLNQYDAYLNGQDQSNANLNLSAISHAHSHGQGFPDREREGPEGGSIHSHRLGSDLKGEEWREKYEIILEENSTLRKGLHEILDCMRKMTDEGTTEVLIQAPVLEELLREMSARGIINYPFPVTSFHMKVCNLEGQCSQLREELHRLRQEERQSRQELFEAQATIRSLTEQLYTGQGQGKTRPRPQSRSPKSIPDRRVAFSEERRSSEESLLLGDEVQGSAGSPVFLEEPETDLQPLPCKNLILLSLQEEVEALQEENLKLRQRMDEEHLQAVQNMQDILEKANALVNPAEVSEVNGNISSICSEALKIQYLQAIRDNQANEINSLMKRLAEIENSNASRLSFLERFKQKAIHQLSTFQEILESSVPLHLFQRVKSDCILLTKKLTELQRKEEDFTLKMVQFHKNCESMESLREERDALEQELGKCQALLLKTATELEDKETSKEKASERESEAEVSPSKVSALTKLNDRLKSQVDELSGAKSELETQLQRCKEQLGSLQDSEKSAQEKLLTSVSREEYSLLLNKVIVLEEALVTSKDEVLKWKELSDLAGNQVRAVENIKFCEKLELDYLTKQVMDLQSTGREKALLAKAHVHMLSSDKEKHLAIQQVEKLLSKVAQLEASSVQATRLHQEREMALISMHTNVILRYRNLFAALHETQRPRLSEKSDLPDWKEAFLLFERTKQKLIELEEKLLEERLKSEELAEKVRTLTGLQKDVDREEVIFESLQKVQDARLESVKWKRKAEQGERELENLRESLSRMEIRSERLEEEKIRLEHTIELKESISENLLDVAKSVEKMGLGLGLKGSSSIMLLKGRKDKEVQVQVEGQMEPEPRTTGRDETLQNFTQEKAILAQALEEMKVKVVELEATLRAKETALQEIRVIRTHQERETSLHLQRMSSPADLDLQDALSVARETISSLQERLKSKEDSVSQYRRLLADVRAEMSSATERHVQEMRALQMTIHQQQQAFTRMKSTLSHPVKDCLNVEGTIKDQLTRIHELEDEVSQLQHAMSNTAAQLTAARSEAHRWRLHAEAKMKEVDSARDANQASLESLEEMTSVRQELRDTHRKLEEAQERLEAIKGSAARESMTDLVNVLRVELEEKDKQLDAYAKSLHNLKSSGTFSEKAAIEEKLHSKEAEVDVLKEEIKELHRTVAAQQVRISKNKAINLKTGVTSELEDLRLKHKELQEEKQKLEKDFAEFAKKRDEEEMRKMKSSEHVARWEESKKWKKNAEKLEEKIKILDSENERFKRSTKNLRLTITRMEKEKHILQAKLNKLSGGGTGSSRSGSGSATATASLSTGTDLSQPAQQSYILAQGEIAKLKIQIADLQELNEKIEFEGREDVEKFKMEIRLLKERIVAQERQLTAYQIAQKGDNKVISEIESMASKEGQYQKEIQRLEEDNLHLSLQIEQLRLETPRLRDRVQHLQKLVEALKAENALGSTSLEGDNKKSQKSLSELEKTIQALKQVIEKLQNENKKLKQSSSSVKLKSSVDSVMGENKSLQDRVQQLEKELEKVGQKYLDASAKVEELSAKLSDWERRANSAEMRLRTLLDASSGKAVSSSEEGNSSISAGYENLLQKMRSMQEELESKNRLLAAAKQSLRAAEMATKPKTSPRSDRDKEKDKRERENIKGPGPSSSAIPHFSGTVPDTKDALYFFHTPTIISPKGQGQGQEED